ncbi:replicative DNA helicase [Geopseudomonas sagittaria]|uniref:Replicative DNA helicase n=1 Tax=Geopseudomonas sagittaria TaxID=1135990 RepID=A0A1I5YQ29_9GAMM|nr:replicative DNA helicase [Pseudomonas sagittaria]SFQ46384.1 replicative DNA helicase [Pseudomonas sagittaria]
MRDPYSLEAEHSVLGAMIKRPELIDVLSADLAAEDFYWPENADLFRTILGVAAANQPIDALTVGESFRSAPEGHSGISYVGELVKNTPSTANAGRYAEIVRERSLDRALILCSDRLNEIAHGDQDAADKVAAAQAEVLSLDSEAATAEVIAAADVLRDHIPVLERREELKGELDGLSTGIADLDEKLQGLRPEQLIILAGRPAMGKTTLAMNIAAHNAIRGGKQVLVVSLEMSNGQLMDRFLAAEGKIPLQDIKSGRGGKGENGIRLTAAAGKIRDSGLSMSDRPGMTMSRIRSLARRHKRRYGLDLMVIDYLQLLDEEGGSGNRTEAVSAMTRGAKLMARELQIPVILLSQLNRSLEQRPNKRPINSDLRESGAIEQDADVIMFVYRDEVYHEDSQYKGVAEVIIGKGRDIETGTVRTAFMGQFSTFAQLAYDWQPPEDAEQPKTTSLSSRYKGGK